SWAPAASASTTPSAAEIAATFQILVIICSRCDGLLGSNSGGLFDVILDIHGFDDVAEQLIGMRAFHLSRRRRVAILRNQLFRQDPEFLDLLDARQPLIELGDLPADELDDFLVLRKAHVTGIGNLMLARPLRYILEIDFDQGRHISALIAEHDDLADIRAATQSVLDRGRRDILAAAGDQDVLLAIDNAKRALLEDCGDVAGMDVAL